MVMTEKDTATALVDRYFAAWNAPEAPLRAQLIADTWADDSLYIDPVSRAEGRDHIATLIGGFQAQFPGLQFHRLAAIDAYADRVRFSWVLTAPEGPVIAAGTDVAVLAGDGRLQAVTGFFDQAPALE